ncbi:MAG: DsbA family protein, partial [Blastocatellia bacterium]
DSHKDQIWMKRYLPFVIIAAVLAAAIGAGALIFRSTQPQPSTTSSPTGSPIASPTAVTPKSVVTIEEFGDYQCPPCGALHPTVKNLKNEYGDRVRFVFYHYPLTQIHKHALEAAHAAAAAGLQGRFLEMHNLLYESQNAWSEGDDLRPIVVNFARQLGLDVERFVRDMDGARVDALVSADVRRANSMGVNATPTLFIDGQLIENENLTVENLRKEINQRLGINR